MAQTKFVSYFLSFEAEMPTLTEHQLIMIHEYLKGTVYCIQSAVAGDERFRRYRTPAT